MRNPVMDEITLLRAIRPAAADFSDSERRELLTRLLAAAASERSRRQAVPGPVRLGRRWRSLLTWRPWQRWATPTLARGAAVVGALAIAAAGLTALSLPVTGHRGAGTEPGSPARRAPSTPTIPQLLAGAGATGPMPAPSSLPAESGTPTSAVVLLQRAAQAAAATPELSAQPDQFVYTEMLSVGEQNLQEYNNGTVASTPTTTPPYVVRSWNSAGGPEGDADQQLTTRDGRWSGVSPPAPCAVSGANPASASPCVPGYLGNLPDTVSGMLSYLLKQGFPTGPAFYRAVSGMVYSSWIDGELVPNRSYALMYQALATVKGIYLIPHVTDSAGRAGIAVAGCVPAGVDYRSLQRYRSCPEHLELIFDPRTYEFIGFSDVTARGTSGGQGNESLLGIGVVSKIGQLP